jgi:hypothetical protein
VGDVLHIIGLALVAMLNPTLLAAVTLMLLLPSPKRLMLGYLLGAYTTSIASGLVIVFALHESGAVSTSKNTIGPVEDLLFGGLALLIAFVLGTDRDRGLRERRERRKNAKGNGEEKESMPLRLLGRGSPRIAFVVGLLLSFPGVAYLVALGRIDNLDAGTVPTALLVVTFCVIQQTLLELPLIGYALAPDWTQDAVERFRAWLARNGRQAGIFVAAAIGIALVARGLVTLLG